MDTENRLKSWGHQPNFLIYQRSEYQPLDAEVRKIAHLDGKQQTSYLCI